MHTRRTFGWLALALWLTPAWAFAQAADAVLSAPETLSRVQEGKITLIDVRQPEEWRQTGVAKGALRISMQQPQGPTGLVQELSKAVGGNKAAPIALICRTGNRSGAVQKLLHDAGFTQVYNVKEGMAGSAGGPGWLARGLPLQP